MSIRFNHTLMEADSVRRGWSGATLARKAGVWQSVVSRFFLGGAIRPETAQKLAEALNQPLTRYVVLPPAQRRREREEATTRG